MISKVKSCGLYGLEGYIVEVEVDISMGLPCFDIVGLPDAAVKESKERVRAALKNCGFEFPAKRITVNLAPADRKKEGPAFDLPICIGILLATEQLQAPNMEDCLLIGELSLDGKLRPVSGALPITMYAKSMGMCHVMLPAENAGEAAVVSDISVYGIDNLYQLVQHLKGEQPLSPTEVDIDSLFCQSNQYPVDFADVKGQKAVKRAIEVAVAGGHNLLLLDDLLHPEKSE